MKKKAPGHPVTRCNGTSRRSGPGGGIYDPALRRAQNLLWATYRKTRSWQKTADRLGLPSKTHAWQMAHGRRPLCEAMRLALLREKPPRKLIRFIRKIAAPFLANRHKSPNGIYGHGGEPL